MTVYSVMHHCMCIVPYGTCLHYALSEHGEHVSRIPRQGSRSRGLSKQFLSNSVQERPQADADSSRFHAACMAQEFLSFREDVLVGRTTFPPAGRQEQS